MTASKRGPLRLQFNTQGSPIRKYIFSSFVLMVGIAIGTALVVGTFRERALESSERELGNTVLLLAQHLNQQFDEFEYVQKDLITYMRSTEVVSNEDFRRPARPAAHIRELLKTPRDSAVA